MQVTLENEQFDVTLYRLRTCYVTEIECLESGNLIARGIADQPEESKQSALEKAAHCLARKRLSSSALMIGG